MFNVQFLSWTPYLTCTLKLSLFYLCDIDASEQWSYLKPEKVRKVRAWNHVHYPPSCDWALGLTSSIHSVAAYGLVLYLHLAWGIRYSKRVIIAGLPIDGSIQKIDLFIYVFFLKNITFIKIIRKAYYSIMYVPLLSWLSDLGQAALCHISFLNYRTGLIKPLRGVVRLSEMTYVKRHSARQIVAAILFLPRPRRNLFNMSKRTQI